MKVALVYDRVNKWGGAERVLLALHKIFPDAPLFTSVYNKKNAAWADVFKVHPSFLQKIPLSNTHHEILAPFMPIAFESFSFDEYDLVISVTSEAAKGILTTKNTRHICYCLTPTRYLWSGHDEYFANRFLTIASKQVVNYLQQWDLAAAKRPDEIIAISEEVKKRIKKYYNRTANVIYPPVTITKSDEESKTENYFLIVSRLVPYKRVDIAINSCNELKIPLKIIGIGSEEKRLKSLAGETIEFLGEVTDKKLIKYYRSSRGLLFPGIEDFGLTVVEAQSFGKPVLAFKGGGALETIKDGKTGMFFNQQSTESMSDVLKVFQKKTFKAKDCIAQSEKFSYEIFKKKIEQVINNSKNKV